MTPTSQQKMKVLERFSGLHEVVAQRLAVDPEFRSLCQDYEECALALQRWSQMAESSPERVAEYTQLLEELGDEIQEVLDSGS